MNRTLSWAALLAGLYATAPAVAQPKKDADLEQAAAALKKLGGVQHVFEVATTGEILVKTADKAGPTASKTPMFRFAAIDDAGLAKLPKSEAGVGLDLHGTK